MRTEVHDCDLGQLRRREPGRREVLADGDDRLYFAGVDRRREAVEPADADCFTFGYGAHAAVGGTRRGRRIPNGSSNRQFLDQPGDERATNVRIAIRGNQEAVPHSHPADDMRRRVERVSELLGEKLLFD